MMPKFTNTDEVEYIFGRTLTARQREMIQHYIDTGERPEASPCVWCDEADMRILTSQMDLYDGPWPWSDPAIEKQGYRASETLAVVDEKIGVGVNLQKQLEKYLAEADSRILWIGGNDDPNVTFPDVLQRAD